MNNYRKHMVYFQLVGDFNVDELLPLFDGILIDETIQKGTLKKTSKVSNLNLEKVLILLR